VTLPRRHYLFASDFDKTLTLDDSGAILSELLGIAGFQQRVATPSCAEIRRTITPLGAGRN
jgi:hypothetical protein